MCTKFGTCHGIHEKIYSSNKPPVRLIIANKAAEKRMIGVPSNYHRTPFKVAFENLAIWPQLLVHESRVSFAQLVKIYSAAQTEIRYSPATIIGCEKSVRFGNPDEDKISTSYAERLNLSVRMHIRRYTRLTNAHSKTIRHHAAMTSLFVAWYNYCRCNLACGKKTTPAMSAGLATHVWSIKDLLIAAA
jgi:hypothetical protein